MQASCVPGAIKLDAPASESTMEGKMQSAIACPIFRTSPRQCSDGPDFGLGFANKCTFSKLLAYKKGH